MKVKELVLSDDRDVQRWNEFIGPSRRLYLHTKWAGILCRTYGFSPHYLYITEKDEIQSVLPLFRVVLPFLKDELVSVPHLESGGMINTEWHQLYLEYIWERIHARRLMIYQYGEQIDGVEANTDEVVMIKELPLSADGIIPGIRSPSTRAKTRKALKQDFNVTIGNSEDILSGFYQLYCRRMKEFGTPPHAVSFMMDIARTFGDDCVLMLVSREGRHVGAGLYLIFHDTLFDMYFTVSHEELRRNVGNFLDYTAMELGVTRGLKHFVRGRSTKDSGTYQYKLELGADPVPLYLYNFVSTPQGYKAYQGKTVKEKYDFAPRIWMKLPSFVTDTIGPILRKWVY